MSELEELPEGYWERQERFHKALAKIKSKSNTTTIPSYREVVDKLEEVEKENALLGRRYDEKSLKKLIKHVERLDDTVTRLTLEVAKLQEYDEFVNLTTPQEN